MIDRQPLSLIQYTEFVYDRYQFEFQFVIDDDRETEFGVIQGGSPPGTGAEIHNRFVLPV
jgi:hypothetical protein